MSRVDTPHASAVTPLAPAVTPLAPAVTPLAPAVTPQSAWHNGTKNSAPSWPEKSTEFR